MSENHFLTRDQSVGFFEMFRVVTKQNLMNDKVHHSMLLILAKEAIPRFEEQLYLDIFPPFHQARSGILCSYLPTFRSNCWLSMHAAMSDPNNSVVYQVPAVDCSGFQASTSSQVSGSVSPGVLPTLLSLITIWRVIILLLVLGNIKNIPLIWHVSAGSPLHYQAPLILMFQSAPNR